MTKPLQPQAPNLAEKQPKAQEDRSFIKVPLWLAQKAKREDVSSDRLLSYCWIYTKNIWAQHRGGDLYAKARFRDLWHDIESDLGLYDAGDICRALEKAGWIAKSHTKAFNGHRMIGYRCLLGAAAKVEQKAEQQELQLTEELPENAHTVESSAQGNADMGEYYQFGIRFYYGEKGKMVQVPLTAPARPTKTAVWVNDPEGWFEPEEIPERESEF